MKKIFLILLIVFGLVYLFFNLNAENGISSNNDSDSRQTTVQEKEKRIPSKFACIGEFCDGSGVEEGIEFTLLNLPLVKEGSEFGCGAAIDFRPHVISKTPAPLNATYQLLFDIKAIPEIPTDPIRNPLGNYSQLHYDSVNLVNGTASVYLSGKMYGPGHCSLSELREQLTSAALQFDTVNQVDIYVNDSIYDWCEQDQSDGEGTCPEEPDYWTESK